VVYHLVIAGLDPAIHHPEGTFLLMDARVNRAFTPVFDELCPRMTSRD
jgi:hypothetical protein